MCLGPRIIVATPEGSAPQRATETKIIVAYVLSNFLQSIQKKKT